MQSNKVTMKDEERAVPVNLKASVKASSKTEFLWMTCLNETEITI